MFGRQDFWVGVAVGFVAGVFGYKLYTENKESFNNLLPMPQQCTGDLQVEELMRQKERLEDLIAEQQSVSAK